MYPGIIKIKDINASCCCHYEGKVGTKVCRGLIASCNLTLRTRIASGRSTPVRRATTSAVDGGDWMDPYETPRDVPKCATSELKLIFAQLFSRSCFKDLFYQHNSPRPSLVGQRRKTCGECLSNSSQCAWCESAQACFYFAAYLTKYPYGECRDWYDR